MTIAEATVWTATFYLGTGLIVAFVFLLFFIDKVEANASGSIGFRPLLVPGLCLLWPLVIWRSWAILKPRGEET